MEREILLICGLCNGHIYQGEPVIAYDAKLNENGELVVSYAHRFSTWCDHFKQKDAAFIKDIGVSLDENT